MAGGFLAKGAAAPVRDVALVATDHLVDQVPVTNLTAEFISTPMGEFPREDATELIRSTGGRVFLVHASLPARVEAEQVRRLRRNALLAGLFSGSGAGNQAAIPLPFWLLVGGLVLAMTIIGAVK